MTKTVRITIELEDNQALELAQFAKRATWEHFRACAVDDAEASVIRDAVAKLAQALAKIGYAPRGPGEPWTPRDFTPLGDVAVRAGQ
jgi:hypothetical protein